MLHSRADRRIQLGPHITQGLGAGANPQIGKAAAEEAAEELYRHLDGTHMLFVAAGMGGGTGTGAAPVIARMARERGILTVGVVTKPFNFEGSRRSRHANEGIEELQNYVDTLIVIPNQNLFRMSNERTTWKEAFKMADHVLYMGVRGVTDLMMTPGLVNLDFADIRTVMAEMGKAMMGTGESEGDDRAVVAAEKAISNPLLEDTSMRGAKGVLINITGGMDMTLFEVDEAANRIREEVDTDANIIFGSTFDEKLNGIMRVSVVATGIASEAAMHPKVVPLVSAAQALIRPQAPVVQTAQPAPMVATAQAAVGAQQPALRPTGTGPAQPVIRPATIETVGALPRQEVGLTAPVSAPLTAASAAAATARADSPELNFRLEPSMARPQTAHPEAPQHSMETMSRAVSDITQNSPQSQHHHQQEEERRPASFFNQLFHGRRPNRAPEPSRPPEPSPRPSAQEAAPRFGGMEARREPVVTSHSDDLDIPAFLRRQAN